MQYQGEMLHVPDNRVLIDIQFEPGSNKNTKLMKKPPRGMVIHWTGAENSSERVVSTLKKRNLSIHFTLDKDGTIVQRADLMTRCAHAGVANDFLGLEIVSRGFARREDVRGSDLRDRTNLDWNEPRDVYRDDIAGKRVNMASFYPAQIESLLWLCDALSMQAQLDIPRRIPEVAVKKPTELYAICLSTSQQLPPNLHELYSRKKAMYIEPAFNRVYRRWRNPRVRDFAGFMGHFHVHKTKCDPGTQPFMALWANGFNSLDRTFPNWKEDSRFR